MTRDEVIGTLKDHADALRARGVVHLALIGSMARGDPTADSVVDVLVDIDRERPLSLVEHSGLRLYLCDILQRDTDVLMRDALTPSKRVASQISPKGSVQGASAIAATVPDPLFFCSGRKRR